MSTAISSSKVLTLLRQKYDKDHITYDEIKGVVGNGRLDFLAVRASWSHPVIEAHEVKVSRRDFVQDNKWHPYLQSCHLFWFVTAPHVVKDVSEIPEEAGWMEVSANAARLFVRKKAPRRVMSDCNEAKVYKQMLHKGFYGKSYLDPSLSRVSALRAFVMQREESSELAYCVSRKIQAVVAAVKAENKKLLADILKYQRLQEWLEKKGLTVDDLPQQGWNQNRSLTHFMEHHAPELRQNVTDEMRRLTTLADNVKQAAYSLDMTVKRSTEILRELKLKEGQEDET